MTAALPQMTEAQFRRQIIELAKLFRWRVAGFRAAQNRRGMWSTAMDGHTGWPDLFLTKNGIALALELKVGTRKTSAEQDKWLDALGRVPGVTARVCYPADWDWIEAKLRGEA